MEVAFCVGSVILFYILYKALDRKGLIKPMDENGNDNE